LSLELGSWLGVVQIECWGSRVGLMLSVESGVWFKVMFRVWFKVSCRERCWVWFRVGSVMFSGGFNVKFKGMV
jgi:hypothetical protein